MDEDDDKFERISRAIDSPGGRALLAMATIAGFAYYAGKLATDPKARKDYVSQVRRAARDRAERDAWHARKTARIHAKWDYFREHGDRLWAERALITVGPEAPFPDARFEWLKAGFRHARFAVESRQAGVRLTLGWDVADRDGGLSLEFDDGRRWSLGVSAHKPDLRQYQAADQLPDMAMARLACRLLATPGSDFSTITLVRPQAAEIREQIWRDHVALHPELDEEPWTFR